MKARFLFIFLAIFLMGAETPKGGGVPKASRSKVVKQDETSNPPKGDSDDLVAAIKEITAELRKTKAEPTHEDEEEKRKFERASLNANEKVAHETQRLAEYTDRLAFFTKALVVVGGVQLIVFFWQLGLIRQSAKAAETAARAAQQDAEATVLAQRAYLNVSPRSPQERLVEVVIKNYGETPATITTIAMRIDAKLPDTAASLTPDRDFSGHYLVKTEWFFYEACIPENLRGVFYFLFGYVEYITAFNECRRLSFARRYDSEGKRFIFISEGGWNHDRPCKENKANKALEVSAARGGFGRT